MSSPKIVSFRVGNRYKNVGDEWLGSTSRRRPLPNPRYQIVVARREILASSCHKTCRRSHVVHGYRFSRHPVRYQILVYFIGIKRPLRVADEKDFLRLQIAMHLPKYRIPIEITYGLAYSLCGCLE